MTQEREWELTAKLWATWLRNRSGDVTAHDVQAMIDIRNIVAVYCSTMQAFDMLSDSPVDDAIAEARRGR